MPPENLEPKTPETGTPSLLSQIIAESQAVTQPPLPPATPTAATPSNPSPQKQKEPMNFGTFAKLIGSLLFVAIIFLGSFLAYIVLNPGQASFFVNNFGINPKDIGRLLSQLVNISFGMIFFVISIAWIVSLFRAFWTPKELGRKRLMSWLIVAVIGIFLFSILSLWAFLYKKIGTIPWDNQDGKVLIYDQDLYTHEKSKDIAEITNTSNMIGPINVFFDLRTNAELVTKTKLFTIESYSINFDGANCNDGTSKAEGTNPQTEQSIVCTFDQIKPYNIRGAYTGKNNLGETETIKIELPTIEIRGLVKKNIQKDVKNNSIVTLDANSLRGLGSPRWMYENGKETTDTRVTETITKVPRFICLKVFSTACDRTFVMEDIDSKELEGSVIAEQDTVNPLQFYFAFTGVNIPENQIVNIEWLLNDNSVICRKGDSTCRYKFSNYGINKIRLIFEVATGERKEIEKEVNVREPLTLERHVKVMDALGNVLNADTNSYQNDLKSFVLSENIAPPETLTLDARDVISKNPGYVLEDARWTITADGKTEEKIGKKVDITLNEPLRYVIQVVYTFRSQTNIPGGGIETASDNIIIDIERKDLIPKLDITVTSDYIPSLVSVDASRSESTTGEIKKFIFDFGDGKAPTEGDSIQQYQYTTAGEKVITLTIIGANGEKASLKRTVVLKDQTKTVNFISSISPGVVNNSIDFEAKGTSGQIEEYIWNFGDNTALSYGYNITHTFEKKGTYTINLTARYADGTQKSTQKTYEVVDSY